MAVSIPWHSSNDWQPTEVTQFINHVNSGAGTLIVRTDAGLAYLNALGNPDGPHALVKELLGIHLAAMLGLPTFDYAVIEVTDLDELPFFKGGKAEPGPAFVTRGKRVRFGMAANVYLPRSTIPMPFRAWLSWTPGYVIPIATIYPRTEKTGIM